MTAWSEARVLDALRESLSIGEDSLHGERWSMLTQVPHGDRRLDALVVDHGSGTLHAIEVKVSRADYRTETDAKRSAAEAIAELCWYVAPAGVIDPATLPPRWGLLVVHADARPDPVKIPPNVYPGSPRGHHWDLFNVAVRRASLAEEAIRRGDTVPAEVARLRAEVESLTGRLERARAAMVKQRERARDALRYVLAMDDMNVCADCGGPIGIGFGLHGELREWRHASDTAERACAADRAEKNRAAREQATGTRYLGGYPGPVIPKAVRDREHADTIQEGSTPT